MPQSPINRTMEKQDEIRRKRISLGISLGVHIILVVVFLLILAWKEPYPPIPEYGIELNFGLDDTGTGDIQPVREATSTESDLSEDETAADENILEEVEETVTEEVIEAEEVIEKVEPETQEIIEDSQMEDSPDVIEPPANQPEKHATEKTEEQVKVSDTNIKPEENSEEKISGQDETREESISHGDYSDQTGDKGDETGEIDARALYGTPGGGGGASLDLAGWIWDFVPQPEDTSNEFGRIVFEIKVDDQGEVIGVRTLEKTVSPRVEKIYREEVESLTFSPTSLNTVPAPVSTGKITFIIKVK